MRQIDEIQFELREIGADVRQVRARLVRLVDEIERRHVTKAEAKRLLAEGTPTVPSYLLESLELLQSEDLKKVEQNLHLGARLTNATLAEIRATRHDVTEPEPTNPEPLEPSEPDA